MLRYRVGCVQKNLLVVIYGAAFTVFDKDGEGKPTFDELRDKTIDSIINNRSFEAYDELIKFYEREQNKNKAKDKAAARGKQA